MKDTWILYLITKIDENPRVVLVQRQKTFGAIRGIIAPDFSQAQIVRNINEIFEMAKLLAPLGVQGLSARRIVPWGQGAAMKPYILEPNELYEFYRKMQNFEIDFSEY